MSAREISAPELFQSYISRHEQTRAFSESGDAVSRPPNAMLKASWEELRRSRIEDMNCKRLETFRNAVSYRVKKIEKMRENEERRHTERCVEGERQALEQSCVARQRHFQADNRVHHRRLMLQPKSRRQMDPESCVVSMESFKTNHECLAQAREALLSRRRNVTQEKLCELPGGLWKEHVSPNEPRDDDVIEKCDDDIIERHDDRVIEGHDSDVDSHHCDSDSSSCNGHVSDDGMLDMQHRERRVDFNENAEVIDVDGCSDENDSEIRNHVERVGRNKVFFLNQQKEFRKKEACSHLVTVRRLYMSLEREQVQQRRKLLRHKQHVKRLKCAKEDSRNIVERQLCDLIAPRDQLTGQPAALVESLESNEDINVKHVLTKRQQHLEKMRDNTRFIDALQAQLREKLKHQRMTLPPLCACASSFWDCNPMTCANNCMFYRNPQAYARAVTSLLASLDIPYGR